MSLVLILFFGTTFNIFALDMSDDDISVSIVFYVFGSVSLLMTVVTVVVYQVRRFLRRKRELELEKSRAIPEIIKSTESKVLSYLNAYILLMLSKR